MRIGNTHRIDPPLPQATNHPKGLRHSADARHVDLSAAKKAEALTARLRDTEEVDRTALLEAVAKRLATGDYLGHESAAATAKAILNSYEF